MSAEPARLDTRQIAIAYGAGYGGSSLWVLKTGDRIADVEATGYFDDFASNLTAGDKIDVVSVAGNRPQGKSYIVTESERDASRVRVDAWSN